MSDPLYRRLYLHADKKLQFAPTAEQSEVLAGCKEFLRLEDEMLQRYHRKGDSGLRVAQSRAMMIDVLLDRLLKHAVERFEAGSQKAPCQLAIVALGGYGRMELSPFSDTDIMFLYPNRVKGENLPEFQKAIADSILYILWDLNLKVGHSTRVVRQTIEEAKGDVKTRNALLESRHVCGFEPIYQQFEQAYRTYSRKDDPQGYIDSRLADQSDRREKHGGTVFLQEPEIKNGVGGLRDYQNVFWMSRVKLGLAGPDELLEHGYLRKNEHRAFTRAYDFLLRVRNELHFQSKRASDLLNLEKQPSVAWNLGYRTEDIFKRVELFMRDYYSHAQNIFRISRILEQRLALTNDLRISFRAVIASRRYDRKREIDGFVLTGRTLAYVRDDVFWEDPERLIRVFRHLQQFDAEPDFDLSCLISESLPLITRRLVHSPTANKSFRAILQTSGNVHSALYLMHELGVLRRFLPEWDGLVCLVQHEYYHRYTADIHTLATIEWLDRIFAGGGAELKPYHRAIHDASAPSALYLMLLLHDIGKGIGIQGHAERGAEMAGPILQRMGVPSELSSKILFIIRNHLEMARFWQRFDIDDPETTSSFVELIGDEDLLRYLYVLTFCDAQGTAEGLWNGFKEMLHSRLFENALNYLGAPDARSRRERQRQLMITKQAIESRLEAVSDEELDAHFTLLPERYFVHNSADEIALHVRMIHGLFERIAEADSMGSLVPSVDWQDDLNLSMTVVTIVTWDRAGLFYRLAGAFSVAGLNIMSSKAISRADHITIDTFYVCEPGGGVVQSEKAQIIFEKQLHKALVQNADLLSEIHARARKEGRASYRRNEGRLRTPIPATVSVYHELSLKRTIIEIQASDQIGLLYRIGRAIFEHGFDITFARISTERGAAVDTFYIEPVESGREEQTSNLLALREALNEIVAPKTSQPVGS